MLYKKSTYTKVHFGDLTFAQMLNKDFDNFYENSIAFFLISNNKKLIESE